MLNGSRIDFFRDTLKARAFVGGYSFDPTNYAHIQLWNPADSGKGLIVSCAIGSIFTATGCVIRLHSHNAALTNAANTEANKYIGGAAPVGEIRYQDNTPYLGTHISDILWGVANIGSFINSDPIYLPEGFGIHLLEISAGHPLTAHFEWIEVNA